MHSLEKRQSNLHCVFAAVAASHLVYCSSTQCQSKTCRKGSWLSHSLLGNCKKIHLILKSETETVGLKTTQIAIDKSVSCVDLKSTDDEIDWNQRMGNLLSGPHGEMNTKKNQFPQPIYHRGRFNFLSFSAFYPWRLKHIVFVGFTFNRRWLKLMRSS